MPEPKARIQNAHDRALATVAGLEDPPEEEVPEPEEEQNTLSETAAVYTLEDQPKPKLTRAKRSPPPEPEEDSNSRKRRPSEDFFEYLQRITPEEWSNSQTAGLYLYKKTLKGNVRLNDDPLKAPITLAQLREEYYPIHGDGNYRVQFTTSLKNLTSCGENVTFDNQGASLGGPLSGPLGRNLAANGDNGITDAIKATSEMLKDGAKAAVEVSKAQQLDHVKGLDLGAMFTGLAAIMPKPDNTMVQFLILDAQKRAEAAERRAEDQRRLDKEEADRRERLAKDESDRRDRDRKVEMDRRDKEADRQRERDKEFFAILLKQSESKADSLNQMTGLLTSFMKAKEMIDDSIGGGPKGPWDLVAGVADSVLQQGPAIVAALKGVPPAQVQQMQNPAPPAEPQPFYEMVIRLAKYFGRDPQLYDGHYLVQMMEEEYGPVYSDIINQPKEAVLGAIQAFEPFGKAILDHPQAGPFMGKVIDAIKFPDTMDDIFGGEEEGGEEEKEPIILHSKARKINGKAAKVEAAS